MRALDQVLGNLGEVDLAKLLEVVNNSLDDRRFYIWMANPEEEAIVTKLGAAGLTSVSETEPLRVSILAPRQARRASGISMRIRR